MPIKTTIDHEKRCVYAKCTGVLLLEDFADYHITVWSLPEVFGYNEIFDARDCDPSKIIFADLLKLVESASLLQTVLPQSKSAVVIRQGIHEELFNFYKTARETYSNKSPRLASFYSVEKAEAWLLT